MKIKKGDNVKIISGNDKGKQGKVLSVINDQDRIIIEGVNIRKKHVRSRKQDKKGEIVHIPGSIAGARVMLMCPKCSSPTRIGFRVEDARKARICKKCDAEI